MIRRSHFSEGGHSVFLLAPVLILLLIVVGCVEVVGQERPKLIVTIVVDQMRQEYLYRFDAQFGDGGFRRLRDQGFECKNAHFNYVPTVTGCGHASIYTGTTPAYHGIIGNDWYDKSLKKNVNCVNDPRYNPVGVVDGNGDVSPWRLLTTTLSDELKLFTQNRSKVIGMSLKDRAATLPVGHMADAAYWFDDGTGRFMSSTYYMKQLPSWVEAFNAQGFPEKYLAQDWNLLLPSNQYILSGPDNTPYEELLAGQSTPTFPYHLKTLRANSAGYGLLTKTPFSNDLLTSFAQAAIEGEQLGKDEWTDFLSISYSATDIINHAHGPYSLEGHDTFVRLDRSLETLLNFLDQKVGKGNYLVMLSSDHGVSDNARRLRDNKIPSGIMDNDKLENDLKEYLKPYFPNASLIEHVGYNQIYFNDDLFPNNPQSSGISLIIASELIVKYLLTVPGIAQVYQENVLRQTRMDETGVKGMVARGYYPKRAGDIVFQLEPGWYFDKKEVGTTHGSPYSYDTHVPVLFYGWKIKPGYSVKYHPITDIAPSISALLNIPFPSGCSGQPIEELFK